jgi:hypothetical protein
MRRARIRRNVSGRTPRVRRRIAYDPPSPATLRLVYVTVDRDVLTSRSTTGKLAVDGGHFCYTLEDVVRSKGVKLYGQTAIPAGSYVLAPHNSPRFGLTLPRVWRVTASGGLTDPEGFSHILLHNGSNATHSLGCLLLGYERGADMIWRSKGPTGALAAFLRVWQEAMRRGEMRVPIIIRNPPARNGDT